MYFWGIITIGSSGQLVKQAVEQDWLGTGQADTSIMDIYPRKVA